jgi:hypothetical protein
LNNLDEDGNVTSKGQKPGGNQMLGGIKGGQLSGKIDEKKGGANSNA